MKEVEVAFVAGLAVGAVLNFVYINMRLETLLNRKLSALYRLICAEIPDIPPFTDEEILNEAHRLTQIHEAHRLTQERKSF